MAFLPLLSAPFLILYQTMRALMMKPVIKGSACIITGKNCNIYATDKSIIKHWTLRGCQIKLSLLLITNKSVLNCQKLDFFYLVSCSVVRWNGNWSNSSKHRKWFEEWLKLSSCHAMLWITMVEVLWRYGACYSKCPEFPCGTRELSKIYIFFILFLSTFPWLVSKM